MVYFFFFYKLLLCNSTFLISWKLFFCAFFVFFISLFVLSFLFFLFTSSFLLSLLAVIEAKVVAVALGSVRAFSAVRLNLPKDLSKETSRKGVLKVSETYPVFLFFKIMQYVTKILFVALHMYYLVMFHYYIFMFTFFSSTCLNWL